MLSWGVGWVDIPLDAPNTDAQEVMNLARQHDTQIIRSAHFWQLPEQNTAADTSVADAAGLIQWLPVLPVSLRKKC